MNRNARQGSALVAALLMMTLIAIAATAISLRIQIDIRRVEQIVIHDKLLAASELVNFWSIHALSHPSKTFSLLDNHGNVGQLPHKLRGAYPGVQLNGSIYDLQSRFNINNISDNQQLIGAYRFFDDKRFHLNPSQRRQFILAMHDWITPYQPGHDQSNLLPYYLQQQPPYLPAHQMMTKVSEIRLVKGVTPELYLMLVPFLTALPEVTPININTASAPVLHSLGNGLNQEQVNSILEKRSTEGFDNIHQLADLLEKYHLKPDQITLTSHYFLVIGHAQTKDYRLTRYTMLKRTPNKDGTFKVTVINEALNTPD